MDANATAAGWPLMVRAKPCHVCRDTHACVAAAGEPRMAHGTCTYTIVKIGVWITLIQRLPTDE